MLGILLSSYPGVVNDAEGFIVFLGAFVIPLSAVIVADFVFLKNCKISEHSLNTLVTGGKRLNRQAFIAVFLGMVSYFLLPAEVSPGFVVFLLTIVLYLIFQRFYQNKE